MCKSIVFHAFLLLLMLGCNTPAEEMEEPPIAAEFPQAALDFAVEQSLRLHASVPDSVNPRSYDNGELHTPRNKDWCSGFFPGSLVYLYEYSGDEELRAAYEARFVHLEAQKDDSLTHDVGFKIQCSFGNALRITGDSASYVSIIVDAADALMARFDPVIGATKSWDFIRLNWNYPVIIDNMMNLEVLFLASQFTGDPQYYNAAISHADKTMANHFREDNSSWHVVSYTPEGEVEMKVTHQGTADESAWARGQAWGLYGYTMCHRFSGEDRYLEQASRIADFILSHPRLPDDLVPYWDYDAPQIPNEPRDASAAAIMASALLDLADYSGNGEYRQAAETILRNLASPDYLAAAGENGNFLLLHGVGNMPSNSEIDTPLSYGDYYFVEALMKLAR